MPTLTRCRSMVWSLVYNRRGEKRSVKRALVPASEMLESRSLMSGTTVSIGIGAGTLNPHPRYDHLDQRRSDAQPVIGTISGTMTNATTGKPIKKIPIQLLDSDGDIVGKTKTNAKGKYAFKVRANGAYVVREVTPRNYTQTSPTFANVAPVGSYASGAGNSSWSYSTGNSNPTFGPVGVYAWDTVAPAGDLPFESPINITVPPINLSPYLSINLNPAVPKDIINNSHQIQTQFTGSSSDTMTLGGQTYELAQFHYHDPSESQVNGQGYSMEEHFVATTASGVEMVLAVFLQLGAYNASLQPILNAATSSLTSPNTSTTIATPINFSGLLPSSMQGWFYEGSLTTPALSQPVNWVVLSTPITLDSAQLQQYEAVAKGSGFLPNARPVQPLDGRQVNQFAYNVNFQNTSIGALNFTMTRKR